MENSNITKCDVLECDMSIRWYRVDSRNTTNNVVQYLSLRLHVSALALGHHQVSRFVSEETIQSVNCNEISLVA